MKYLFRKRKPLGDTTKDYPGAAAKASELYARGFNCAEAVLQATTGREDPELIALAKGFGDGIGGSGCLCGAISGGIMALGLEGRPECSQPLVEAFKEHFRTTCCRGLTKDYTRMSREHLEHCRGITAETAAIVERLLREK
ncbi:MAG: C-GCAxxG-C-C family protein [Desulfuromonadales bacterium]|nr:C-GCAxxG-C-C family protein [Desulfuromonadales bacterium]